MQRVFKVFAILMGCGIAVSSTAAGEGIKHNVIWSDQPLVILPDQPKPRKYFQRMWDSGVYPIGNGRLGSAIYGGIEKEQIQFNEDTLWIGDEDDTGSFQNFGELFVALEGHADAAPDKCKYRRELDIENSIHTVSYELGGARYQREYFASHPANVMVYRFTADKKGAYTGSISIRDAHGGETNAANNTITISGTLGGLIGLKYEAQAMVINEGGSIIASNGSVSFKECDSIVVLLDAGTDYLNQRDKGWKQEAPHERIAARLSAASTKSLENLRSEHVKDYQSLFKRLTLDFGSTDEETLKLKTEDRLARYREGKPDPDLEEMLYQHARYLMISSSRPGDMPATLQGVWNTFNHPPWRSDYHTDVNVEMNYWFVDQANLSECFLPLAEWVNSIREVRKEATKKQFNVRGWATRSENGIFGGATYHWVPGDASWVAQNIWDHYAFTLDKEYLRNRAYPVMKELCEFWEDSLKQLPDGQLVSPKSISPEHGPEAEGNSYEQQLSYNLFSNYIMGSEALCVDADYRDKVAGMRAHLLAPQIGKWGQLQEWAEDLDDPKDQHRHLSHMIAIHPGHQISPLTTPKLAEAAKVSMNARGDGSTGWSKVWKICIWARLHDGDRAYKLLGEFIKHNIYPNLFGFHPPFQIDCNFGYAAGVNEMLVQSHLTVGQLSVVSDQLLVKSEPVDGAGSIEKSKMADDQYSAVIHLLPALPKAWPDGSVKGMRVRGGFEVDIDWEGGKLLQVTLRGVSNDSDNCTVRYGNAMKRCNVAKGKSLVLRKSDFAGTE